MYQSGRAGERETRQKSVSLPPKAGELTSLYQLTSCSQTKPHGEIWTQNRKQKKIFFPLKDTAKLVVLK